MCACNSDEALRCGERAAVVCALGSKGPAKNALLNKAFETQFSTAVTGSLSKPSSSTALVATSPGTIVINCDGVTSDAEAKIAALSVSRAVHATAGSS